MIKILFLMITLLASGLSAEWRVSKKAGIKVIIPDGWNIKAKGEDLEVRSPDKNIFIILNVLNDNDDAIKEIEKAYKIVEKYHNSVETSKPVQTTPVNNLTIVAQEGTATTKKGNKPADWNIGVTRNLKSLIIVIMATDGAQKKYENELKEIMGSFQKI